MTDARHPERWLSDRRLLRLSDAHFRSFAMALLWSVSNRTDGVIDPDDLPLIPNFAKDSVKSFIGAGLWEPRQGAGRGWQIADFETTQTTSAQLRHLEDKRAKEREKKATQRATAKAAADASTGTKPAVPRDSPADCPGDGPQENTGQARTGKDRPLREGYENNGAAPFTPTAEHLRRIDANVRRGYES